MSRPECLKENNGKGNKLSGNKYDEESAARTRPFSLEEIMLRRKNKELLDNVKDSVKEACNVSPVGSSENIADHFESRGIHKQDKNSSSVLGKHALEELEKVSSRKKVESTSKKEYNLAERKERGDSYSGTKLSAGLRDMGRINKNSQTDREMHSWRKHDERVTDSSEYEAENKHIRDSINRDRYLETDREKSQRKIKKKSRTVDDENPKEYKTERKHGTYDQGKRKKWSCDDSEKVVEKKHHIDLGSKDLHADSRGKYGKEFKRTYENGDDDKIQDRNAARKKDLGKHRDPEDYERKERQETVKSHYEESKTKRRWSSREREERRRSLSLSPRAHKYTYRDEERKELTTHSLKNSSRKPHSDADRSRVATNGSSSHHRRHGGPSSGLGGYSPRKRKTEAAVKTPSPSKHSLEKPSKHSLEKKRAGWDLPPVGTDNSSSAFQLSNTTSSAAHDVAASSVDPVIVKPLSVPLRNDSSTGKNVDIDSVQLTQATRPMRRLYIENLSASVSEKDVMESLNNLLLSSGVNRIQGAQPCISSILHKDKGQALVEFLTAEDASAALSFDGSILFGSTVKIRRPKDYVEVTTGELERSVDSAVTNTISDVVIDSPDKIFIGGISKHLSSEMLMEIAGAFGSLKAYRFGTEDTDGPCAFLEYMDHSVTLKACAGLNGMKLAGEVLTVVQATPNALPLENGGKPLSYEIPEHAKPLLCKPTQVLKIKDVFTAVALSSLSDVEIEEVLEDVRLECARFGTIKSINVVKRSSDRNEAIKLEEHEVINVVESNGATQDFMHDNSNNARSSFSGTATCPAAESAATSEVEINNGNEEIKEDKFNGSSSADVDELADEDSVNKSCQAEQFANDIRVEDMVNRSISTVMSQECDDHHCTSKDQSESHYNMVADDIGVDVENKSVGIDTDLNHAAFKSQEGCSEPNAGSGTKFVGSNKVNSKEDDIGDHHLFEPGCILVEFRRTEACCRAAHCLHGRFFDGRMVTLEYVALNSYKARFPQ